MVLQFSLLIVRACYIHTIHYCKGNDNDWNWSSDSGGYLPLVWLVRQTWAAVEHNDVILTLGLHTTGPAAHTPISHVSLCKGNKTCPEGLYCFSILSSSRQEKKLTNVFEVFHHSRNILWFFFYQAKRAMVAVFYAMTEFFYSASAIGYI